MAEQREQHGGRRRAAAHRHEQELNGADGGQASATPRTELEADVIELREQVEQERGRAETNLANWQRTTADFQNYKRRTEQEREERARFANTALVLNILPAVDDLDLALQHLAPELEGGTWIEGVRQIQRKLKGALEAAGVSEIVAAGEPFDPNLHEAISQAAGEEGRVVAEARRGYRLGSRVIRPAMVVVGDGATSP